MTGAVTCVKVELAVRKQNCHFSLKLSMLCNGSTNYHSENDTECIELANDRGNHIFSKSSVIWHRNGSTMHE